MRKVKESIAVRGSYRRLVLRTLLFTLMWIQPVAAISQTILSPEQVAEVVVVRNLTVEDGVVSGDLLNRSPLPLRDVQLLIRHIWHWRDEQRPGQDGQSRAVYYAVRKEIPPGGSAPFTYRAPPPLSSWPDGHFETAVSVAGFAQVVGKEQGFLRKGDCQ